MKLIKIINSRLLSLACGVIPFVLNGAVDVPARSDWQKQMEAFVQACHPRLGRLSSAAVLTSFDCKRIGQFVPNPKILFSNESVHPNIHIRLSLIDAKKDTIRTLSSVDLSGISFLVGRTDAPLQTVVSIPSLADIRMSVYTDNSLSLNAYLGSAVIPAATLEQLNEIRFIWHKALSKRELGYVAIKLIQNGQTDAAENRLQNLRREKNG